MTATTCTLTRQGGVDDLSGPWPELLDEATLTHLLLDGVDAVVPVQRREAFRRAMVVALSDGSVTTEHPVHLAGGARVWLAWSLRERGDGRLDATVVDVTRPRAGVAWRTLATLAPALVGASGSVGHARRVLVETVRTELDGTARLVPADDATGLAASALEQDHGRVRWRAGDDGDDACHLALPLQLPAGDVVVLEATTPYRLDLWLDAIHLVGLAREVGAGLRQVARTEAATDRAARERQLTERLARELDEALRLLDRTLRAAAGAESPGQREYLLSRAARIGERLGRLTGLVGITRELQHEPVAQQLQLVGVLNEATASAAVEARLSATVAGVEVLADPELLRRALEVLVRAVVDDGRLLVDTRQAAADDDEVELHLHHEPPSSGRRPVAADLTSVGLLLADEFVTPWGGRIGACADAGVTDLCDGLGVVLSLPSPRRSDA